MDSRLVTSFQQWFIASGGWYHPSLRWGYDSICGLSLFAEQPLPKDTVVVEMPQNLALTPAICRHKVLLAFASPSSSASASPLREVKEPNFELAADWIVFYHFLARALGEMLNEEDEQAQGVGSSHSSNGGRELFSHQPYIRLLPRTILTPTSYSEEELALLRATPLHGDAYERRSRYRKSLSEAMRWLGEVTVTAEDDEVIVEGAALPTRDKVLQQANLLAANREQEATFDMWVWAHAIYSSRAFPPMMVASNAEEAEIPRSLVGPVLLPGMDAFNHARGVPVTWVYPYLPSTPHRRREVQESTGNARPKGVALQLGYEVAAGEQVFNCYGGKSNEEFLCGYGFVLPDGADDQLTLVLGGGHEAQREDKKETQERGNTRLAEAEVDAGAGEEQSPQPTDTSLALSRPWGSKHYWRIVHPSSSEKGGAPAGLLMELRERLLHVDCEAGGGDHDGSASPPPIELSWLFRRYYASPPSPGEVSRSERLEALRLDGEVLESLEELLCAKNQAFKAIQKQLDALQGVTLPEGVRKEVYDMIVTYRRGQAAIHEQAIEWTRAQMDLLVELIDELEEQMDEDEE